MALYKDGNPVSGLNSIPRLTLAQYNALNVKPKFWIRTDAPESYKKLSADQVSYDENNTVEDMIDDIADIQTYEFAYSTPQNYQLSFNYGEYKLVGINTLNSSNQVLNTAILPMEYFKVVNRVILGNFIVAYGGNNLLYASSTGGSADVTKVVVFGISK